MTIIFCQPPISTLPKRFMIINLALILSLIFQRGGMVAFKVGDTEPAIILRKADNAKLAILFTVDNVRTAYEELKQKGVEFLEEPFEIMTGLSVEFSDPFGNKF